MKKQITTLILGFITLTVLVISGIYIIRKENTMILQGEVEVKTVDLSSKVPARVSKINVQKGDFVKRGQVLIELDTPDIDAKAKQAQATLALARAQQAKVNNGARSEQVAMAKTQLDITKVTYDRLTKLYNEGVIPAQKLDEAKAKYDAALEQYNMLKNGSRTEDKISAGANVEKAIGVTAEVNSYLNENKIISPIDGTVVEISVEEAELVGSGFPLITVADNKNAWVTFNLREDLLPKIKVGTEFSVNIPALSKEPYLVRVNYISALGNFANWRATKARGDFDMKTFEVRANFVDEVEDLRAGMSALFDWKKLK